MKLSFNGKGNRRFTAAPPQLYKKRIYAPLRICRGRVPRSIEPYFAISIGVRYILFRKSKNNTL